MGKDRTSEYSDEFVDYLALLWGEGCMSPGGYEEVARIVADLDVENRSVLDIGCGIGGATCFLVSDLEARRAVGVDIEASLVKRARLRAAQFGLTDRIEFRAIGSGALPFGDACFDLVFSKDSIIHVADKVRFFREAHRVLKPGGWIAIGDWLRGDRPFSSEMTRWLADLGLDFEMWTLENMAAALADAGFGDVAIEDRNQWYRAYARDELERMEGPARERLISSLGPEGAEQAIGRLRLKAIAVEQGHLRPGHLRGRKRSDSRATWQLLEGERRPGVSSKSPTRESSVVRCGGDYSG